MSARIPIGWTACVEGEPVPCGIPLERLGEDGNRGYGVYSAGWRWSGAWLAYRVVEAERPALEYAAEPVLTRDEGHQLASRISRRLVENGWSYTNAGVIQQLAAEELLKFTREVGR